MSNKSTINVVCARPLRGTMMSSSFSKPRSCAARSWRRTPRRSGRASAKRSAASLARPKLSALASGST